MTAPAPQHDGLLKFLTRAYERAEQATYHAEFDDSQEELLRTSISLAHRRMLSNPVGDPLSVFYLVARAWTDTLDEQAELLGTSCLLYILAADLTDDVQDDDLHGTPYESVGPAIAVNSALSLLFLSLDVLRAATEREPDPRRRLAYLELFNRTSLAAVGGQHRDLISGTRAPTPAQLLAMDQAKRSSLTMIAEMGALYARCDARMIERYRHIGELLVQAVQVVDDVRDIFGKSSSPDLSTGKMTYPVACFLETATPQQREQLADMRTRLPGSLREIRTLLYDAGAIRQCAETVEHLRVQIHQQMAATGNASPAHRTWLFIVDSVASDLYKPRPVPESAFILHPHGTWYETVHALARRVAADTREWNSPAVPPLIPWHLPQWVYDPQRKVIFYPDVEGMAEDVLPPLASFFGLRDTSEARAVLESQAAVVMAHEYFHYWRDASGNLSSDYWFEELAALRLTMTYLRSHQPDLIASTAALSKAALASHPHGISARGHELLEACFRPGNPSSGTMHGYEVPLGEAALMQCAMTLRLIDEDSSFELLAPDLLPQRGTADRPRA